VLVISEGRIPTPLIDIVMHMIHERALSQVLQNLEVIFERLSRQHLS